MNIFKRIIFLYIFAMALFPAGAFAQPPDPCTDPLDPCPIDNNVYILIAGAIGIAAKKTYDYKKKIVIS